MKKVLLSLLLAFSLVAVSAQAPEVFNYQAVARDASGNPIASQVVSFRVSIIQGSAGGSAVYTETHSPTTTALGLVNLEVGNGLLVSGNFSTIDWGNDLFFIRIEMDITGGTNYQLMGTSQLLSVPYALQAGNVSNDQVDDADADPTNEHNTGFALNGTDLELTDGGGTLTADLSGLGGNTLDQAYDQGGSGSGRVITADAGEVEVQTSGSNAIGVRITHNGTGVGLLANAPSTANTFSTIQSSTGSNSNIASAVVGNTDGAAYGVSGQAQSTSTAAAGVYGSNLRTDGGHGVLGIGLNGVVGQTDYQLGFGVYGLNNDNIGPIGNAVGLYGLGYTGVWGDNNGAGGFSIYANGDLGAAGVKAFQIDHPNDPTGQYLRHFSIESDEVLNIYRGTGTFDANGVAVITTEDYVDLVNRSFTYQLTPIGAAMSLYISREFDGGSFEISGGTPGKKVSWMLVGERNDPYLEQHPEKREVEVDKTERDRGTYLLPELYNADPSLRTVKQPELPEQEPLKIQD